MKKLILFLLLPLWVMAQTSNGQEQEFDYGIKNNSTQTITTPPYLTTTGTDGTQGKIPSAYIEKTDNKQNSLAIDGTGTKYPTVDAVNAALPKTYATTVYVNTTSPNTATVFDDENPPVTNDNALKSNTDNLYIGSDASTWVYNGGVYVTKIVSATSNFFIRGTTVDAGNSKTENIERSGNIKTSGTIESYEVNTGNVIANNFIKSGGTSSQFLKADGSVDATIYEPALGFTPENVANKQNSLAIDGTGTKYPTVDAVNVSTVTKIPQNQVTWGNKLMILCGDSTTWQMTATGLGFDYMTAFYRLPGNKMENITGYVNFGSSGYTLNGFVNGDVATPPVINTTANLGIGSWDYYGHNIQTAISQKTAIEYRKSIPSQEVVWVLCYGINDCILNASVGNQTQAQITAYLANLLNQAVLKFKQEFPKDQVILRISNTMSARPYNAGAGFPSPTEYPTFGTDKPTDVALVTKWNIAIRDAYFLVSQQNLNTILLDTHEKIFGSESAEIDANFRPFMTDLVHPSGLGYNAIADELAYIFTDERKQTNFSRLDEATKRAVLLSNQPYDNYSDYVSDVTKYKMVLISKLTSNAGVTYIDVPFSKTIFDAAVLGEPFYIKKGNVTIKITTFSTAVQGPNCRIIGVTPSAEFQAETGSTSIYVDQPNNANNLHKTGNETFTGIKSVTSTGATNVNGFYITSNGTGATSPLNITSPSTSTGRAINITQSGNLGSKAIYLFNNSTLGAESLSIEINGNGQGITVNSLTGSTSDLFKIRRNNVDSFTFNYLGNPFWKSTPLNASGTYDIVVRRSNLDANIGRFEVVPSITFATIASPAFTGTPTAPTAAPGTTGNQIATLDYVQANSRPYKVYTALLSQSGTSAPTATVLENTLGSVSFACSATGNFNITIPDAIDLNKIVILIHDVRPNWKTAAYPTSTTNINIKTVLMDSAPPFPLNNSLMLNTPIEIRVYN